MPDRIVDAVKRPRLILASRSPRRIELLREAGYEFEIQPADVNEDDLPPGLTPTRVAGYLAQIKAQAIASRAPDAMVLGADTVVAIGSRMFGKADTVDEARAMLRASVGRQEVLTGVCVIGSGRRPVTEVARSVVEMRSMSDAELEAYLATGQWRGKAGAYGIQDHDPAGDPFVKLLEGEMSNVVGLPMRTVRNMLGDAGLWLEGDANPSRQS